MRSKQNQLVTGMCTNQEILQKLDEQSGASLPYARDKHGGGSAP
jgi:hypothetical protein